MRDRWLVLLAVSLAVVSVAASSWMAWEVRGDYEAVRAAMSSENGKEEQVPVFKSTWKTADGITREAITPRLDGESADAHAARHKVDADALKAVFPPG